MTFYYVYANISALSKKHAHAVKDTAPKATKPPEVTVKGVLLSPKFPGMMYVLTQRKNGYADVPGGHVEPGHTVDESIGRESGEEIGISTFDQTIRTGEHVRYGRTGKVVKIVHTFALVLNDPPEAFQLSDEHRPEGSGWKPIADVLGLPAKSWIPAAIHNALARRELDHLTQPQPVPAAAAAA